MNADDHGPGVHEVDRERAAMRIKAAVEAGVLDLAEAGRRLSAVHRAPDQHRLRQLVADLDFTPRSTGRAVVIRAGVQILLFTTIAALLVLAFLQLVGMAGH